MSVNANITKKERDCLVNIWQGSREGFPVRVTSLAESLKIKPPTVEELLERLENKKLIIRNRGMVMLSNEGKATYRRIMMGHRALETFLVQCGDNADRACPHGNPIIES